MPTVPAATGVALLLAALNADGPYALLALTVNVYAVPLVRHVTCTGAVSYTHLTLPTNREV